jgi:hypothetical protein
MFQSPRSKRLLSACAPLVLSALGCQPKPQPTKLPPKEVPHLQNVGDGTGSRGNISDDAVQAGSNQARISYDCGPPHGKNVEGKGVLSATLVRCEIDTATKAVTLAGETGGECAPFVINISDYKGAGTYNTSTMSGVSFGLAKLRQPACNWDGSLCLEWSQKGAHPETTCTVEVNSDGGLQYGTSGATVSGTFACSAFVSPFKGCAGVSVTAGCGIARGSFSAAGCQVVNSGPKPEGPPPALPAKGKGKRSR